MADHIEAKTQLARHLEVIAATKIKIAKLDEELQVERQLLIDEENKQRALHYCIYVNESTIKDVEELIKNTSMPISPELDIQKTLELVDKILVLSIRQQMPARSRYGDVPYIYMEHHPAIDELNRDIEVISAHNIPESDNYVKLTLAKCLELKSSYDNNIEQLDSSRNTLLRQMCDAPSAAPRDAPRDNLLSIISHGVNIKKDANNYDKIKRNIGNGYGLLYGVDIKNAINILSKMINYVFDIYKNRDTYIHIIDTYESFLEIFRYLLKYTFLFSSYEMTKLIIDISHYLTNSDFTSENIIEMLDMLLLDREYIIKHLWKCGVVFSFDATITNTNLQELLPSPTDQYFYDKLLEHGEIDITFNFEYYLSNMHSFNSSRRRVFNNRNSLEISRYGQLNHSRFKKLKNWTNRKSLAIFHTGLAMFFNSNKDKKVTNTGELVVNCPRFVRHVTQFA